DAVDLRLTRIVKQAELVRVDNQAAGADLLRTGRIHTYAAPRPALLGMSAQLSGSHVLEDSFATISFAQSSPRGTTEIWRTSASFWKRPRPRDSSNHLSSAPACAA